MRMNAQQIIQEALEVDYQDEFYSLDKTPFKWLFTREPSESKIKSVVIRYLTNRIVTAEEAKEAAERKSYEVRQEALRIIRKFSPEEALKFHVKWNK